MLTINWKVLEVWLIWCRGCGVCPLASHVLIYSWDTRPSCLTSHQLYGCHAQWLMSVPISGPGCRHVWLLILLSATLALWCNDSTPDRQSGGMGSSPGWHIKLFREVWLIWCRGCGVHPLASHVLIYSRDTNPVAWPLTNYMAVMPSSWCLSPYLILGADMFGC